MWKKCFNLKKQLIINKLGRAQPKFLKFLNIENRKILPARNGFARIVKKERGWQTRTKKGKEFIGHPTIDDTREGQ